MVFFKALLQGFVDLALSQRSGHQNDLLHHLSSFREQSLSAQLQSAISNCPPLLCWAVESCMEKDASSWLSALPLEQYGFTLHKGDSLMLFVYAMDLHHQ